MKARIPGVWLRNGLKYPGHDLEWVLQEYFEFRKNHYHQPSDEYYDNWDLSGAVQIAQVGFLVAWFLTNEEEK